MNAPLLSSKKCPSCQQWSQWQQHADDRCEHCGELLDPRASQDAYDDVQRTQRIKPVWQLDIKPEDGASTRLGKRLVYGGQVLFAAIMSALVALVAAAAA
ncbi:hypothetical protein [Hymenobacter bucti]|uniref:TFIIB-type zinc ribbon-containing protein n=1 Tax=Hymenobacter bucti TaxID=1844114 RepID=A0ABW4QNM1_9BACT